MTSKKRVKKHAAYLAALHEPHAFWKGNDASGVDLIELLARHYGVNAPFGLFLTDGPTSRPRADRWAVLAILLAGDLYPAFKRLPSKGGRPPRQIWEGILFPYPHAHAARFVQLFNVEKSELKRRGETSRVEDVCAVLKAKYCGKHPRWRYNNMRELSTLKRALEDISEEIRAHPERFLPLDGSEPVSIDGEKYLPLLPQRSKARV
jgi:hypothetical protein